MWECKAIMHQTYPSSLSPSPAAQRTDPDPRCLLELPSLSKLNLSHNRLSDIPDVLEWSSCLTVENLFHNSLQTMPLSAVAPSIRTLYISHNQIHTVPCTLDLLLHLTTLSGPQL